MTTTHTTCTLHVHYHYYRCASDADGSVEDYCYCKQAHLLHYCVHITPLQIDLMLATPTPYP